MNLVLSGGGIKGLAYIGVLRYIEEKNIKIAGISGTSIGSLMGLLINTGYSSKEIENIALNIDVSKLENLNIGLLLTDYGLDNGEKISFFIKYLLKNKGYDERITFNQLYKDTGIHLFITCCDIEDYSQKIFDYRETPDEEVWFACKCSMSIPLIWTLSSQKYIDGCFSRNIPVEIFPTKGTIAFCFLKDPVRKKINNIKDYIMNIITCSFAKGNSLEIEKYNIIGYNIVTIKVEVSALQFKISDTYKKSLIDSGYTSCIDLKV
jgi:predicted acylesterase/phospholipase RssA